MNDGFFDKPQRIVSEIYEPLALDLPQYSIRNGIASTYPLELIKAGNHWDHLDPSTQHTISAGLFFWGLQQGQMVISTDPAFDKFSLIEEVRIHVSAPLTEDASPMAAGVIPLIGVVLNGLGAAGWFDFPVDPAISFRMGVFDAPELTETVTIVLEIVGFTEDISEAIQTELSDAEIEHFFNTYDENDGKNAEGKED